jgi:7-cyano-7-deazaguanine synthase
MSKDAVVLLSGGVDSSTLLRVLRRERPDARLFAVSFFYGQKHARELACARWQAGAAGVAEHQVVDLAVFGAALAGPSALTDPARPVPDLEALAPAERDQPPTYVPHRNLILLSLASAYAESRGCDDVCYGAQRQDQYGYWDCTPEFVERLNRVLALNRRRPVRVLAPLAGLGKAEVVRLGLEAGVDFSRTWTCYRGADLACRACPSCVERLAAFQAVGVADPLPYSP